MCVYIYKNSPGSISVGYIFLLQIRVVLPREFSVLPCIFCTEISEENQCWGKCANHRHQNAAAWWI